MAITTDAQLRDFALLANMAAGEFWGPIHCVSHARCWFEDMPTHTDVFEADAGLTRREASSLMR